MHPRVCSFVASGLTSPAHSRRAIRFPYRLRAFTAMIHRVFRPALQEPCSEERVELLSIYEPGASDAVTAFRPVPFMCRNSVLHN